MSPYPFRPHLVTLPLLGTLLICPGVAGAEEALSPAAGDSGPWANCAPAPAIYREVPLSSDIKPGQTELSADEVVSQAGGESRFRGNVRIQRDANTLLGDEASYDQRSREVTVEGNVVFHSGGLVMQGEHASMRMEEQSGLFEGVRFYLPQQHAFGSAERLTLSDAQHSTLRGVGYTTCSPGHEDWLLSASSLQLDQESNTGEAFNTVLRFKGVPIFYSPYLNFPLAGRKSGLLPPTIGTSKSNGTDIRLPLYWNIAPNYDATLTPRNLTARGPMVMGEFRMLGEQSEGQVRADYMEQDKVFGAERSYLAVDHRSHFANGWGTTLTARRASDRLYLNELGEDEAANSTSHLERRFDLNYRDPHWDFRGRVQNFQTLSGTSPYQRLPQLRLKGQTEQRPNRLQLTLDSEAVAFAHPNLLPTGTRVDLEPALSLPLQGEAWYLTPRAAWRHTEYSLQDYPLGEEFSRSLPIVSLDSGLFFERDTSIGTHTVEPRLFYLEVPYEAQDELPLFDTASSAPGFEQLFRANRFNGADRQGDTRQITAALTTRLLDETSGRERLRASIGRIRYFTERQVQLTPADPVAHTKYSDLFAELQLRPTDRLRLGMDAQYDTGTQRSEQLNGRLRYQPDPKRLIGLDYRYNEPDALRQSDALLFWPVARQWQLLGRWRYDLAHKQNLELLAGLEYGSCCWAVRLIGRGHRNTPSDELESSVHLTFEFKGLGSLGGRLEDTLEEGLLTYE